MRGTLAVIAGVTLAVTACGGFLGFGDDDASGPVASPDAGDASVDASTADGGSDPVRRFCDSVDAAFCEDFDRMDAGPDAVAPPWQGFTQDGGGTGHLIVAEGHSLPNAFAVEGTLNRYAEAYVETMAAGAASVVIEFALGIPSAPPPSVFVQVTWNNQGIRQGISMHLLSGGDGYWQEITGPIGNEQQFGLGGVKRPGPWTTGWHTFVLEIDWPAKIARVVIDGMPTAAVTELPFFAGSLYVEVGGTAFDGAVDPRRLLFDDLIVRAR